MFATCGRAHAGFCGRAIQFTRESRTSKTELDDATIFATCRGAHAEFADVQRGHKLGLRTCRGGTRCVCGRAIQLTRESRMSKTELGDAAMVCDVQTCRGAHAVRGRAEKHARLTTILTGVHR